MIRKLDRLVRLCPGLLAVLIVCLLARPARAQSVVFRNECGTPVVVQTATVVKGVLVRDSPCLLRHMEATPKISLTVTRIITVHDAKTNRLLYRDVIRPSLMDAAYGIIMHPRLPGRITMATRRVQDVKPGKKDGARMAPSDS